MTDSIIPQNGPGGQTSPTGQPAQNGQPSQLNSQPNTQQPNTQQPNTRIPNPVAELFIQLACIRADLEAAMKQANEAVAAGVLANAALYTLRDAHSKINVVMVAMSIRLTPDQMIEAYSLATGKERRTRRDVSAIAEINCRLAGMLATLDKSLDELEARNGQG